MCRSCKSAKARAVPRVYKSKSDSGWRRLIGSPKLPIIFHETATKYKSLLQKMTYEDKGSYESSPPCTSRLPKQERFSQSHMGWHFPTLFQSWTLFQGRLIKRATNYRALLRKMTCHVSVCQTWHKRRLGFDIFERSFKAESSKLKRLLCHVWHTETWHVFFRKRAL